MNASMKERIINSLRPKRLGCEDFFIIPEHHVDQSIQRDVHGLRNLGFVQVPIAACTVTATAQVLPRF